MGLDFYAEKVYLEPLAQASLPTRYSPGSRRRAAALERFASSLQSVGQTRLDLPEKPSLLVVNRRDWRRLFSYPYGLPFTRTRAGGVSIIAAADYPNKLLKRWDEILLRAARCGLKPPGEIGEFLDLLVGHEWGHAAANLSGLRTRVKWFDEFMASYLFLAALKEGETFSGLTERFVGWSELVAAGSAATRADLGAFEYPLAKLSFDNLAWFQGVFTLGAWKLLDEHDWDFPLVVRARLTPGRGDLARLLVDIAPSLRDWFATFGPTAKKDC